MEPALADDLSLPIGPFVARLEAAHPEDSLRAVSRDMAEQGLTAMPVANSGLLVGLVTESSVARALAEGRSPEISVGEVMVPAPATLLPHSPRSEALRLFGESGSDTIVVLDHAGHVMGVLTPSRLLEHRHDRAFHGRVGGMATPFGVYLTNGIVSGGVSSWALLTTGMVMFGVFALAGMPVLALANTLPDSLQKEPWLQGGVQFLWLVLFMAGLRLLPLSGTHAAEHMVVHAIERGEDLVPEVVRRMPRVHPRCGTNLAVGAMVFIGIITWEAIKDIEVRLLVALVATLALWQPMGNLLQRFVTTKPPTGEQIESGIAAGNDLLKKAVVAPVARPSFLSRLALSGLFQVLIGATVVELLLWAAYEVLRVPSAWRVT